MITKTITYQRGTESEPGIVASLVTPALTDLWIEVPSAALRLGGKQIEPQVGDIVKVDEKTLNVVSPLPDFSPFGYCDVQKTRLRIHLSDTTKTK